MASNQGLHHGFLTTAAIVCACAATPAAAQERSRSYNIPAQSAADALNEWARQSDRQIVFPYGEVDGRWTPAVRGNLTPRQALDRLIGTLGLVVSSDSNGTTTLARSSQASSLGHDDRISREDGVAEILVVGKRSLNADIQRTENGAQPYVVVKREDIARSGAATVEELLRTRTTVASGDLGNSQIPNGTSGNISNISLRGLNPAEVLILIDGRRSAGFGLFGAAQQPDINAIPLASVERIEILPATGSGIYGGGATGGVINIILRRDYSGLELSGRAGISSRGDAGEQRIGLNGGTSLGPDTSVTFSASYARSDALAAGDRDFVERGRAQILRNDPNAALNLFSPPLGATTNVRSAAGQDLTLLDGTSLNSPITHVPAGYAGAGTDGGAGLLANAGRYNLALAQTPQRLGGAGASLLPQTEIKSASLTLRHNVTPAIEAFIDLSASENRSRSDYIGTDAAVFYLPGGSPTNPFQEDVLVNIPGVGLSGENRTSLQSYRGTGGLIFQLPGSWRANLEHTWHRVRYRNAISSPIDFGAADLAIATGMFDPFRDPLSSLAPYATDPDSTLGPGRATTNVTSLRVGGPLPISLPGGAITISALAERRTESLSALTYDAYFGGFASSTYYGPRSQRVETVYLEARVPVVAPANDIPFINSLDLELAGRADWYHLIGGNLSTSGVAGSATRSSDFASINPTIAIRYKPVEDVILRASYATGFLPPALNQLVPSTPFSFIPFGLTDPSRGGEPLGLTEVRSGGNPDLEPERSTSWSVGAVLEPRFLRGLRFSVDWTRITKRDNIGTYFATDPVGFAYVLQFAPDRIVRAAPTPGDPFPVGPIIAIDDTNANLTSGKFEALDLNLRYAFQTGSVGEFEVGGAATRLIKREVEFRPGVPPFDQLGLGGGLKWRASGWIDWKKGPVSARWNSVYYDGFFLNTDRGIAPQGTARVPSQIYHDLQLGLAIQASEFTFGIRNLFDKRPPLEARNGLDDGLMYSTLGDPRMRTFYIGVRHSF